MKAISLFVKPPSCRRPARLAAAITILAIFPLLFSSASFAQQEQNWVKLAQVGNPFYDLNAVDFVDSLRGWTAAAGTEIFRTEDGGHTWESHAGDPMGVNSISMLDSLYGWCGGAQGSKGKILYTTDGGRSWQLVWAAEGMLCEGTWSLSPTRNITVADSLAYPERGVMLSTIDGGLTWKKEVRTDTISSFKQIQFIDSSHGWILYWFDGGSGLLTTSDGGSSWEKRATPETFSHFCFVDSLSGFGIADYPKLYRTTDGGRSWVYLTFIDPANQPIPIALAFPDTLNGWFFSISFYQGDLAEAIYRTRDGGVTWEQESIGLARKILAGQMLDTLHGWAACSGGIVLGYKPTMTSVKEPNASCSTKRVSALPELP